MDDLSSSDEELKQEEIYRSVRSGQQKEETECLVVTTNNTPKVGKLALMPDRHHPFGSPLIEA